MPIKCTAIAMSQDSKLQVKDKKTSKEKRLREAQALHKVYQTYINQNKKSKT